MNHTLKTIEKLEYGFDDQLFKSIDGWDIANKKSTIIKYFDTLISIKTENKKINFHNFKTAMMTFFTITNDHYRNIEITLWNDEVIPLHHLNFVEKDQIADFIKHKTEA